MPIKASTDKLVREVHRFGDPPISPTLMEEDEICILKTNREEQQTLSDKFKSKKSKVTVKSSGHKFQWEIMKSFGSSDIEISKFQDPYHWLMYFPPMAVEDLNAFGFGCD
ncbi:hypothetical protein GIB67_005075 [Kingdonia uniflora]|uniref:Uncharacterized protein n=1 Tax=Kingdonia uniflora TaxID=39325 RepID=A0A7J7KUN0_9MAGN|nr:hypothetical protein GIB67_005075 [Kingdonia uniflora]